MVALLKAKERELGPYASEEVQMQAILGVLSSYADGGKTESAPAPTPTPASSSVPADKMENFHGVKSTVESVFERKDWKYKTSTIKEGLEKYSIRFSADNWRAGIEMQVFVGADPSYCTISAVIPDRCDKLFEYNLCTLLSEINYKIRYGVFKYNESDGEITVKHTMLTDFGLNADDFEFMFRRILNTADDDDFSLRIHKCVVGRFSESERQKIINKVSALIKDLAG